LDIVSWILDDDPFPGVIRIMNSLVCGIEEEQKKQKTDMSFRVSLRIENENKYKEFWMFCVCGRKRKTKFHVPTYMGSGYNFLQVKTSNVRKFGLYKIEHLWLPFVFVFNLQVHQGIPPRW
jgi:hypothetical protein